MQGLKYDFDRLFVWLSTECSYGIRAGADRKAAEQAYGEVASLAGKILNLHLAATWPNKCSSNHIASVVTEFLETLQRSVQMITEVIHWCRPDQPVQFGDIGQSSYAEAVIHIASRQKRELERFDPEAIYQANLTGSFPELLSVDAMTRLWPEVAPAVSEVCENSEAAAAAAGDNDANAVETEFAYALPHRPAARRDHTFHKWYFDKNADTHRSPATIRDLWNRLNPGDPVSDGRQGIDTVKKGIATATKELAGMRKS